MSHQKVLFECHNEEKFDDKQAICFSYFLQLFIISNQCLECNSRHFLFNILKIIKFSVIISIAYPIKTFQIKLTEYMTFKLYSPT